MMTDREGMVDEQRMWDGDRLLLRFLWTADPTTKHAVCQLGAPLEVIFERAIVTEKDAGGGTFTLKLNDEWGFDYLGLGTLTGGASSVPLPIFATLGSDRAGRVQCMGRPIFEVDSASATRGICNIYCLCPRHRS